VTKCIQIEDRRDVASIGEIRSAKADRTKDDEGIEKNSDTVHSNDVSLIE
jgi:hypothetical protein